MVVPVLTLVTIPDVPTVAIPVLVLLHVPPMVVLFNDVVVPMPHIAPDPVIDAGAEGKAFTVIALVTLLPPRV